jgi:basic membrane lipoprotein Med (substrate-binding protein (PBP1-ABC) superfamily)
MKKTTRRDFLKYGGALGAAMSFPILGTKAQAGEVLKIGVVNASPAAEIGWSKQHALALDAVKAELGDKISVTVLDSIFLPQDAERVFRELASSGNNLIFGTSFSLGTPMQKVATRFPHVAFEHCSGIVHTANIGTFEAKYYEGAFVAGAASGHMSKSKKIGFVGSFPIPDVVGPANALLLGAQSVDPTITCNAIFLNSWFDPGKEKEAAKVLISQGCDVICAMTDTGASVQVAGEQGAYSIGYASDLTSFAPKHHLTAFMLDWSSDYLRAVKGVLDGNWKSEEHWDGLGAGVVKMAPYNAVIPTEIQARLKQLEADIGSGKVHPYAGELKDQDGNVKVQAGAVLSDADIRGMNWFVKGMIGKLA